MRVVTIRVRNGIREADLVELRRSWHVGRFWGCGVHGEKDWPRHERSDEADYSRNLEEAKKEVAVEGLVGENMVILRESARTSRRRWGNWMAYRKIAEIRDPAKQAFFRWFRCLFIIGKAAHEGAGRVDALESLPKDQKQDNEYRGQDERRNNGGQQG